MLEEGITLRGIFYELQAPMKWLDLMLLATGSSHNSSICETEIDQENVLPASQRSCLDPSVMYSCFLGVIFKMREAGVFTQSVEWFPSRHGALDLIPRIAQTGYGLQVAPVTTALH